MTPHTLAKIKWFNGYADENIVKTLLLDSFPYYILIDDKKKIVKMYAKRDEVEALLNQEHEFVFTVPPQMQYAYSSAG
jgi:hypothetical protein